MAEKFEFTKTERQADAEENLLVQEGVEMSQMKVQDKGVEKTENFDSAVAEITERLASIANRLAGLPQSVRQSFIQSISGMSGEDFPAYDLLRSQMAKNA
jgi:hypothetical protein